MVASMRCLHRSGGRRCPEPANISAVACCTAGHTRVSIWMSPFRRMQYGRPGRSTHRTETAPAGIARRRSNRSFRLVQPSIFGPAPRPNPGYGDYTPMPVYEMRPREYTQEEYSPGRTAGPYAHVCTPTMSACPRRLNANYCCNEDLARPMCSLRHQVVAENLLQRTPCRTLMRARQVASLPLDVFIRARARLRPLLCC
jgi:hypothetical protein